MESPAIAITNNVTPGANPPEYVFDLIQISLLAASGDIRALSKAVTTARSNGADNRQILRAMFRSDEAFHAGIYSNEFLHLASSLQAGYSPLPKEAHIKSA
ncbi:MAG TPA: hypothetical protein PLY93_09005 [Turneriella sp.]|nr:hypothetical protein [Turneriella sp.]